MSSQKPKNINYNLPKSWDDPPGSSLMLDIWRPDYETINIYRMASAWRTYDGTRLDVTRKLMARILFEDGAPIILSEEQQQELADSMVGSGGEAKPLDNDIHEYKMKLLRKDLHDRGDGQKLIISIPKLTAVLKSKGIAYPPKIDTPEYVAVYESGQEEIEIYLDSQDSLQEDKVEADISIHPWESLLAAIEDPTPLMRTMCEAHYFIHHEDKDRAFISQDAPGKERYLKGRFHLGATEAKHIRQLITDTNNHLCTDNMARVFLAHHLLWKSPIGKQYRDQASRRQAIKVVLSVSVNMAEAIVNIISPDEIKDGGYI